MGLLGVINPKTTWAHVNKTPEKLWDFDWISCNTTVTWDIVQQHPDKPWDYWWLSTNPNITWDIIQQNPDKPWWDDNSGVNGNPNLTWDIIRHNPDKPWDYPTLSRHLMSNAKHTYILQRRKEDFINSELCKDLITAQYHPRNMNKWKGWKNDKF